MKRLHIVLIVLFTGVSTRFYDPACPDQRVSIGACLAGLCPAGSECVGNFCCKNKKAETAITVPSVEEEDEEGDGQYGRCASGYSAIGECISDTCPDGYICEKEKCCKITSKKRVFTMTPPQTTTQPSTIMTSFTENISAESSTFDVTSTEELLTTSEPYDREDSDENEIEQLKKEYQKLKDLLEKKLKKTSAISSSSTFSSTTLGNGNSVEEIESTSGESVNEITETSFETSQSTTTSTSTQSTTTTTVLPTTTEEEKSTICPVGEPIGECISNLCPEGHACFNQNCCILTPEINCTDTLPGCKQHLCESRGYKEFMTKNCAKTCARCHFIIGEKLECRDRRTDCAEWAAEGFCQSTLYTTRQKMKFCGKSCKLC